MKTFITCSHIKRFPRIPKFLALEIVKLIPYEYLHFPQLCEHLNTRHFIKLACRTRKFELLEGHDEELITEFKLKSGILCPLTKPIHCYYAGRGGIILETEEACYACGRLKSGVPMPPPHSEYTLAQNLIANNFADLDNINPEIIYCAAVYCDKKDVMARYEPLVANNWIITLRVMGYAGSLKGLWRFYKPSGIFDFYFMGKIFTLSTIACARGNLELFKFMINHTFICMTAGDLTVACEHGRLNIIEYFIKKGWELEQFQLEKLKTRGYNLIYNKIITKK